MTYREAIQSQVKKLEGLYENAENLRDAATAEEKCFWNDLRILTSHATELLNRLDNKLDSKRAAFKLKGKY